MPHDVGVVVWLRLRSMLRYDPFFLWRMEGRYVE